MNDLSYREPHTASEKFYAIFLMVAIFIPLTTIINKDFFVKPTFSGFLEIFICIFYFYSGINYWFSPKGKSSRLLVEISLLTQSFQIYLLGFVFINYYGLWAGLGFTDTPDWTFSLKFAFFTSQIVDDYIQSNEITAYVNLVSLGLYIYFIKMKNRKPLVDLLFKDE